MLSIEEANTKFSVGEVRSFSVKSTWLDKARLDQITRIKNREGAKTRADGSILFIHGYGKKNTHFNHGLHAKGKAREFATVDKLNDYLEWLTGEYIAGRFDEALLAMKAEFDKRHLGIDE